MIPCNSEATEHQMATAHLYIAISFLDGSGVNVSDFMADLHLQKTAALGRLCSDSSLVSEAESIHATLRLELNSGKRYGSDLCGL